MPDLDNKMDQPGRALFLPPPFAESLEFLSGIANPCTAHLSLLLMSLFSPDNQK